MVTAEFDTDTGILNARFKDMVTLSDILDYIDSTRLNRSYPRKLKIITDAKGADYNFAPDDLHKIVEANNRSMEQYDYIIDAIITDDSKTTAISMLYQEFSRVANYRFKVFSTKETAINWLIHSSF